MLRISFLAARNRASGEVSMLETAFGIAAGGDVASVTNRYHALLSPEGAADRADYSHILLVVETWCASITSSRSQDCRARRPQVKIERGPR
jgi:hypothetical protein